MLVRKSGKNVNNFKKEEKIVSSPKIVEFFKIVKKVYPKFEVNENTYWDREIHNYKHAIYTETLGDYKDAWYHRDWGFSAMIITVVDGILKVEFEPEFLKDLNRICKVD